MVMPPLPRNEVMRTGSIRLVLMRGWIQSRGVCADHLVQLVAQCCATLPPGKRSPLEKDWLACWSLCSVKSAKEFARLVNFWMFDVGIERVSLRRTIMSHVCPSSFFRCTILGVYIDHRGELCNRMHFPVTIPLRSSPII